MDHVLGVSVLLHMILGGDDAEVTVADGCLHSTHLSNIQPLCSSDTAPTTTGMLPKSTPAKSWSSVTSFTCLGVLEIGHGCMFGLGPAALVSLCFKADHC